VADHGRHLNALVFADGRLPCSPSRLDEYRGFHYIAFMASKPMTGPVFFVLTALADGPRHGYGIVSDVAELSQGRVKLKIGSLYGVPDRLAAEGLIEPDREEAHDGRLRRYHRLTRDGRRALAQEAELRAATARVVRARLGVTSTEATR
jgi:PadR family transcriptional regulator, regulatory protein PadR